MTTWHFFRKSPLSTKRYKTFVLKPNTVILICVKAFITGTKKLSVFRVVVISMGLFVKSQAAWYLSTLIWIPWLTIFYTTNCDKIPWTWNSVGHKCILFFPVSLRPAVFCQAILMRQTGECPPWKYFWEILTASVLDKVLNFLLAVEWYQHLESLLYSPYGMET